MQRGGPVEQCRCRPFMGATQSVLRLSMHRVSVLIEHSLRPEPCCRRHHSASRCCTGQHIHEDAEKSRQMKSTVQRMHALTDVNSAVDLVREVGTWCDNADALLMFMVEAITRHSSEIQPHTLRVVRNLYHAHNDAHDVAAYATTVLWTSVVLVAQEKASFLQRFPADCPPVATPYTINKRNLWS